MLFRAPFLVANGVPRSPRKSECSGPSSSASAVTVGRARAGLGRIRFQVAAGDRCSCPGDCRIGVGRLRMVAAARPGFSVMIPLARRYRGLAVLPAVRVRHRRQGSRRVHQRRDPDRPARHTRSCVMKPSPPCLRFAGAVPAPLLPGPKCPRTDYYSLRFMGFFIRDAVGAVIGQFPTCFRHRSRSGTA